MKQLVLGSVSITMLLLSCSGQKNDSEKSNSISFVKEIPQKKNGEYANTYKYVSQMVDKLNLDRLEEGFDSIQVRIWVAGGSDDTDNVFMLWHDQKNWNAQAYFYSYERNKNNSNKEDTIIGRVINMSPKSGWNSFTDKLFEQKISDLPNMDSLPINNIEVIHGQAVNIEISTKSKYRLYSYYSPSSYQEEYWQAKNIVNILKLLEDEFEFRR